MEWDSIEIDKTVLHFKFDKHLVCAEYDPEHEKIAQVLTLEYSPLSHFVVVFSTLLKARPQAYFYKSLLRGLSQYAPLNSKLHPIQELKLSTSPLYLALAAFGYPNVRQEVAQHEDTHPLTLDMLSFSVDQRVVENVASNHNTSPQTLIRLTKQPSATSAYLIAIRNPSFPYSHLAKLARQGEAHAQMILARRPDTLVSDFEYLLMPHNGNFGDLIASNSHTPLKILRRLVETEANIIIKSPKITLSLARACIPHLDFSDLRGIEMRALPFVSQLALTKTSEPNILRSLASFTEFIPILDILSSSPQEEIRNIASERASFLEERAL